MLFDLFISKFNSIADNTPFFIKYSSDKSSEICSQAKKSGITSVIKMTSLMAIKGVEYAKLNTTLDKVANEGKVLTRDLPWGKWNDNYKNIIDHTKKDGTFHQYARLYFPEEKYLPKTIVATETMYLVNGLEMTRQELIDKGYMVNSHWYPKDDNCFNVDIANVELIEA